MAPGAPIAPTPASPPANQIAVHLTRHAATGDTIVVSLSPEELGRVEIEIELDGDGRARAHVAAELPMTLELIQRDAALLEQALEAAGVDLAPDALTFDLRRDGQSQLVYKHAISTVMPLGPIQLQDEPGDA